MLDGNQLEALTDLTRCKRCSLCLFVFTQRKKIGATHTTMHPSCSLLDELHLLVHPIAVRKGMRLFDEGETPIPLRLISSETFKTGVLNLVYGPAESTGDASYEDAKVHLAQPKQ